MAKWTEVKSETGLPPMDQMCIFTLANIVDGRRVKICTRRQVWAGVKIIAFIPVKMPEPFGGACLPIDPDRLREYVLARSPLGVIVQECGIASPSVFHQIVRRYEELAAIWATRSDHLPER